MKLAQSCPTLCDPCGLYIPWNCSGQNIGVGIHSLLQGMFPSPGDLSNPGFEPGSPALQVGSLPAKLPGKL